MVGTELHELLSDVLGSVDIGVIDRHEIGTGEAMADVADAGDSRVGCDGRDKGTEAEVALPYLRTKGGVVAGDRDSLSQQRSKGAVDHIQVEERDVINLWRESTVLGPFEKGRIGGKRWHVIHPFVKAGV